MKKRIARPGVREGYDRWSTTYDETPNPLVALDRRYTPGLLQARQGERILDAGCGTGGHLRLLSDAGSRAVGVDFSLGMLRVARRTFPGVSLVQADLNREWPFRRACFDALLCSLVSEHLTALSTFFSQAYAALRPGGRLVISAFHPDIAAAGVEANFQLEGTEYRLGAEKHTVDDYLGQITEAGFRDLETQEYSVDAALLQAIPEAEKYAGRPLLLIVTARAG